VTTHDTLHEWLGTLHICATYAAFLVSFAELARWATGERELYLAPVFIAGFALLGLRMWGGKQGGAWDAGAYVVMGTLVLHHLLVPGPTS